MIPKGKGQQPRFKYSHNRTLTAVVETLGLAQLPMVGTVGTRLQSRGPGQYLVAQTLMQHWNSSWASLNTSTSRKSRSRWSTERRPWRSRAGGNQGTVSHLWQCRLHLHPPCPSPPSNPLLSESPLLTGTQAPAAAGVGAAGSLMRVVGSPSKVVAVARGVTGSAWGLTGNWRMLSLVPLPVRASPGHSQKNHMVAATVWTHSRRFCRAGQGGMDAGPMSPSAPSAHHTQAPHHSVTLPAWSQASCQC